MGTIIPYLAASALLFTSPDPPPPSLSIPAKVTRVLDGDTVDVQVTFTVRVRLLDCWAPEKNQEGGQEATEALRKKALGKEALLFIPLISEALKDHLTFGRVLGDIWVDGRSVGDEMVSEGFATEEK